VNAAHLALKMRKMREDHEEEEMESGELNLVPFLDIVTNVIMFLMMTTTFAAALADINVSAPKTSSGATSDPNPAAQNELNLTVSISEKGTTIAASGGVLYQDGIVGKVPTIPKIAGGKEYDYAALTKKVAEIKAQFGDETKVIINANPDITYETVVAHMDAIRTDGTKTLFPDVLLAAGVN
jgi:biopolymer transport protein TolR